MKFVSVIFRCSPKKWFKNFYGSFYNHIQFSEIFAGDKIKKRYVTRILDTFAPISAMRANTKLDLYKDDVRTTLEAVSYYRKQLQYEINRLTKQYNEWEAYKIKHKDLLQALNFDFMIEVIVRQARMLIKKKFMHFKDLIGRCETEASDMGYFPGDGSKATKFISSSDLKDLWSRLGSQIDNLKTNFDNLDMWKNNNWMYTENGKFKADKPKNLTKVKKKDAKPSREAKPSKARKKLSTIKTEKRRKKNSVIVKTEDSIPVPSNVRERKHVSKPDAIKNLKKRPRKLPKSIGGAKEQSKSIDLPKIIPSRLKSSSSLIRDNDDETQNLIVFNPCNNKHRKSILKKTDSPKTNLRNVIFTQKCSVQKLNLSEDSDDIEKCYEYTEEDLKEDAEGNEVEHKNVSWKTEVNEN